jgi:hypothetical protein
MIEPRSAAGTYVSRVVLICLLVSSASATRPLMTPEVIFESDSVLMSTSSSRMLPLDSESSLRILSSNSWSWRLSAASDLMSWFFCFSRSGRSSRTTRPSS